MLEQIENQQNPDTKSVKFLNKSGEMLKGILHLPKNQLGGIVFLHGFPGSSQYIVSQRAGESFSKEGFIVLRFDFSGSGESEGEFFEKRLSKEVLDVEAAVDFLCQECALETVVLVGHSTGAIIAALYAHRDSRIKQICLLGGVGNLSESIHYDFSKEQVDQFCKNGYITYHRPGTWLDKKRLSRFYYDEFFKLDTLKELGKYCGQTLIVHGGEDEIVPVTKDPIELYQAARSPKHRATIQGADHKFTNPSHWQELTSIVSKFIKSHTAASP